MSSNSLYYILIIPYRSWNLYNGNISQSLSTNNSTLMFDNGNGSSPRSANLSFSYHCDISSPAVTTSSIERSASTTPAVTTSSIERSASTTPAVTTSSIERSGSTTPAVTTSSIEPSVSTIISLISTNVIFTPFPSPMKCCYVTTSSIKPSVSSIISMTSTNVIFTPSLIVTYTEILDTCQTTKSVVYY